MGSSLDELNAQKAVTAMVESMKFLHISTDGLMAIKDRELRLATVRAMMACVKTSRDSLVAQYDLVDLPVFKI